VALLVCGVIGLEAKLVHGDDKKNIISTVLRSVGGMGAGEYNPYGKLSPPNVFHIFLFTI
jgi:hypothetical protein